MLNYLGLDIIWLADRKMMFLYPYVLGCSFYNIRKSRYIFFRLYSINYLIEIFLKVCKQLNYLI